MEIIVLHNQSIFDIAVQEYGMVTAAFDLALINGLDVTDSLVPGQVLNVPDSIQKDHMAGYFKGQSVLPATALPLIAEHDLEDYLAGLPGMLHLMLS